MSLHDLFYFEASKYLHEHLSGVFFPFTLICQ